MGFEIIQKTKQTYLCKEHIENQITRYIYECSNNALKLSNKNGIQFYAREGKKSFLRESIFSLRTLMNAIYNIFILILKKHCPGFIARIYGYKNIIDRLLTLGLLWNYYH